VCYLVVVHDLLPKSWVARLGRADKIDLWVDSLGMPRLLPDIPCIELGKDHLLVAQRPNDLIQHNLLKGSEDVRRLWPIDPLASAGAVFDPACLQHLLSRIAFEIALSRRALPEKLPVLCFAP